VGDWHDRLRPGVTRRIRTAAGMCSIENHQLGNGQHTSAPVVPLADAADPIAARWATHRADPPPAPPADQLAAAPRRTPKGRR